MQSDLMHIISPVAGLAANVAVQLSCSRLLPRWSLLRSVIVGFAIGFACTIVIDSTLFRISLQPMPRIAGVFTTNILTYIALGYCYFHFVNLGETARRIRILKEIRESENGLTMEEILSRYNAAAILRYRLDRLLRKGQIIYRDGRYFLGKPTMLFMARIILLMKQIVTGKRSEF